MPNRLKFVIGVSAVSVVLDLLIGSWASGVAGLFIVSALYLGHGPLRPWVVALSAIGFCLCGVLAFFLVLGVPLTLSFGPSAAVWKAFAYSLATIRCGLTVWVLRKLDVKEWMHHVDGAPDR